MSEIRSLLKRGALWLASARLLVNISGLVSTLVLARLLTPNDFGLVAIATALLAIVSSVTELSLSNALVHHKNPTDAHFDSAWTLNVLRGAIIGGGLCLAAYPIAKAFGDDRLIAIMLVLGGVTILSGAANPKLIVFARNLSFKQDFVISVSQKLVGLAAGLAIAYFYRSYWALVLGSIASQLTVMLISYVLIPYLPRFNVKYARELMGFSVWLSLGQAVNTLNWKSDQLAIGYLGGQTQLGLYTFGDNLAGLPTREVTAPIAQMLFPGFAKLADNRARLAAAYQNAQSTLCTVALPIGFGFSALAGLLINFAVGEQWIAAIPIIQVLSVIIALQTLGSAVQPLAMAMGDTKALFWRDVLNLGIRLPLIFVGFWFGGLIGVVYARGVSGILGTLLNMALIQRLIGVSVLSQILVNWRALASASIMISVLFGLLSTPDVSTQPWHSLLSIVVLTIVGGALYVGLLLFFWMLSGRPRSVEMEFMTLVHKFARQPLPS